MKNVIKSLFILFLPMMVSTSYASVVFTFAEVGSDVTMTASGTIDTNNLVSTGVSSWGGTGLQNYQGYDIMGGTSFGSINASYAFNAGTDFSDMNSLTGPWSSDYFGPITITGSTSFATYNRDNVSSPGFGLRTEDLVNGLWTADQNWTILNASFASLGLNTGLYSVSDILTGESISFDIGSPNVSAVPVPAAAWLFGSALLGFFGFTRKKANA